MIVKGKARLGQLVWKKGASVVALTGVRSGDERSVEAIISAAKANL